VLKRALFFVTSMLYGDLCSVRDVIKNPMQRLFQLLSIQTMVNMRPSSVIWFFHAVVLNAELFLFYEILIS